MPAATLTVPTPSQIAAAFVAVGRDAPHLEALSQLAGALSAWEGDLDGLCAYVEAQTGSTFLVRKYAPEYQTALVEAVDPVKWADRLLIEAVQHERWATDAEVEAAYRAKTAATWEERGDAEMARRYRDEEANEQRFARHCRESAAARRARAAELTSQREAA